jgi:methionyl-tRNA formyltransferase
VSAPLRIVFMGTAPLAAVVLDALLAAKEFNVIDVVTQPDKPKGRDLKLQPSAVKELALARGLPVLQPLKARDPQFIEELRALTPELIVVAAYGQILPQALLDVPKFGCLNVHTSILPKYRGAAPIQWAILNGDAETGVTIMRMDAGLDSGAIVSEERTPIRDEDNSQTLHDRLAQIGGALLARTIPEFVAGKITPRPQPGEGATYARKITKDDGKLDWSRPARALWNQVRGLTPWPGTFTFLQRETPALLKIWRAELADGNGAAGEIISAGKNGIMVACGDGALRITELQREGGKRLSAEQFLAGFPLAAGERFA